MLIFISMLIACKTTDKNIIDDYVDPMSIDLIFDFTKQIPGPFVEITIGGQKYIAFVDTGNTSSVISISDEIIGEYSLLPAGYQRSITTSGEVINTQYLLPEFSIPGIKDFRDVVCTSMPPKNYAPNEKPDAILGLSAFYDYNILIAYNEKKLYLYEKIFAYDYFSNWAAIDLLPDRSGLFFYGQINSDENPYLFYLDTGTFVRIRGQLYDQVLNQKIASDLTSSDEEIIFVFGGERIYNNKLFAVRTNNMTDVDIFLGLNFLLNNNVFIDLGNKKILIKKEEIL